VTSQLNVPAALGSRKPLTTVRPGPLKERAVPTWQRRLQRTLVLGDFVIAAFASILGLLLSSTPGMPFAYAVATVVAPFLWVGMCAASRAYERRFLGTGSEEFRRIFDAGLRLMSVVIITAYAAKFGLARSYAIIVFPVTVSGSLVVHYALRKRLHHQRAQGLSLHSVVVVGRERACSELIRQLRREPSAGFSVVGACVDYSANSRIDGIPVLGGSGDVLEALASTGADTVAVGAWSDLTQTDLRQLSWKLEGTGVALVVAPSLTDIAGPRIHIRPVSGLPLLHVEQPELSGARRALKGAFDRSAAGLTLLLLGPIILACAAAVRLTSKGPAFFRQTRVGLDGRTFTILKLRSMFTDAEDRLIDLRDQNEASDGLLFKMKADPRVTPVGKFLRRYSLDELPQLWNIVRGDMSLVGPRPPLPTEVSQYQSHVHRRLLVKPGLTGLWQVSGRSDLSWDESVRLDLHYVENWSLALDAMIIWKTVFAVMGRSGAY
jgi:exopolysaccharide biosynthesis polyprenyl glycosylphosphotransferase